MTEKSIRVPHTVHAARNVADALADPEPYPLTFELACLWQDLDHARRNAYTGGWSTGCEHVTHRIAVLTVHMGKPLPWEQVSVNLLEDGIYQAIHDALGMHVDVDMERVAEVRRRITTSP
jgi:hypothetical protein